VGIRPSLVSMADAIVGPLPGPGGVRLLRHRREHNLNYESTLKPGSLIAGSVLNDILTAVTQATGQQEAFESGLRVVMSALSAECALIYLGTQPEDLAIAAYRDAAPTAPAWGTPTLDLPRLAAMTRQPVRVEVSGNDGISRMWLAVPLQVRGRLLGVLAVLAPPRPSLGEQAGWVANTLALALDGIETEGRLHKLQDQLRQVDRISTVGQLTLGAAHEINNAMTAVIGFAQLLEASTQDEGIRKDLDRIINEARRPAQIVQDLLAFARQPAVTRRAVDLNQAVRRGLGLTTYQLHVGNITVSSTFAPDLPPVFADPSGLEHIIINIVINACQAMADQGDGHLSIVTGAAGDKVWARFEDTGPGIPAENLDRVFEPFFTTKSEGSGTGLGLSLCRTIIEEHGGQIWAEPRHSGATFVIELPIHQGKRVS
jgi:signal transduction histidine kinase